MVFNVALSGIRASSKELDVIGNNIANSATVGFKSSRAEFGDIYTYGDYNSGNTNTNVGGGVRLTRVHQTFATGTINPTNNALDMAVQGGGFFVLSNNGAKVYTRAGQFTLSNDNYIVNSSNQRLTGLLADKTGKITSTSGDLFINTADINPNPTSSVITGVNLKSNTTPPTADWAGGASPATDTFNYVNASTIYDSLGNSHTLSMYFIAANSAGTSGTPDAATPPGTVNQWYVAFQVDGNDVPTVNPPPASNTSNLFTANFNKDGTFVGVNDTSGNPLTNNLIPISIDLQNGANPLAFNVDLSNSTQFGTPYSVQSINNDGYTTGSLTGIDIDITGVILGTYTNGQSMAMGQIQLANFADPESLQNLGNTSWAETVASGQALISTAGSGSLGLVLAGNLEDSNVDLTSELVNLIGAQRSFQANAQTIRTDDAVVQTIINIR